MGSAARRRGAYGGEYLRAGLRLRAQGERRLAKSLVKLGQKGATKSSGAAAKNYFRYSISHKTPAGPLLL
jgi:hypothetical protein